MDSNGNPAGPEEQGLLLWNGGTVCHNQFNLNAADAICRILGHKGRSSWSSGLIWSLQNNFDIHMDKVECSRGDWSSCSYNSRHIYNCGHSQDVHLTCRGENKTGGGGGGDCNPKRKPKKTKKNQYQI